MNRNGPAKAYVARVVRNLGLRLVGFTWMFCASLLIAGGVALGLLGVAGGILVRANPDSSNVINYDPSRIASIAPIPLAVGVVMVVMFILRARKIAT